MAQILVKEGGNAEYNGVFLQGHNTGSAPLWIGIMGDDGETLENNQWFSPQMLEVHCGRTHQTKSGRRMDTPTNQRYPRKVQTLNNGGIH